MHKAEQREYDGGIVVETDLAHPCRHMDVFLNAVEDRAVVFQESTVVLTTAASYGGGFNFPPQILEICHSYRPGMLASVELGVVELVPQAPA